MASKGQQQQYRGQPTSFLVVDDQQVGPSQLLTFALMPLKHFNPPVASATGKESQHNISGLSTFFRNLQSVMTTNRLTSKHTSTSCLSSNHHCLTTGTSAANGPASDSSIVSQQLTAVAVEPLPSLQSVLFRITAIKHLKVLFRTTPVFQKQLISCC